MRTLMVGAGATGGFYGGLLLHAGRDITFLLRTGRAAQIRQHGLHLTTHTGQTLHLQPPILTAYDLRQPHPPFDLIILSTKSYQLPAALDDITPAVGPQTAILPILNGMAHFAQLDDRFGPGRVLGGSVRVVADLDPDGRIHQLSSLDEFNYGERSSQSTPRILAVDALLKNVGFTANLQPGILATLWQKWWILSSMGAICILARGTIGQAASVNPSLALAILDEATGIARANGYPPDPSMLAQHKLRFTDPTSTLTSSLYRDLIRNAPVEADQIFGDLLAHARGLPTPLLTAAYIQLKVYESTRAQP